jgi:hypothetical protein
VRGGQGPLVTDAYLAVLAIEHGCELITTDSDFARFPGLRWAASTRGITATASSSCAPQSQQPEVLRRARVGLMRSQTSPTG